MSYSPHQSQTFYDPASGMHWTDFEEGSGIDDQSHDSGQVNYAAMNDDGGYDSDSDDSDEEGTSEQEDDEAQDNDEVDGNEKPTHLTILDSIMEWGDDTINSQKIEEMWERKGGWEGWAQIELATLFDADREVPVFWDPPRARSRAADLVIGESGRFANDLLLGMETVVIELKCESGQNEKRFEDALELDLLKIEDEPKSDYTEDGCYVYAIALSMSDEGAKSMEGLRMTEYRYQRSNGEEEDVPFRLWWKERYIPG